VTVVTFDGMICSCCCGGAHGQAVATPRTECRRQMTGYLSAPSDTFLTY
jgi:hypothetical protein